MSANIASMLWSAGRALRESKHVWICCVTPETRARGLAVTCQLHSGDGEGNCNGTML